ncbi:NAD(P)-binding domain-containing protein [Streptomyces sp. NPDC015220]|uniref:NAD(P)-binding domain-containing protein n=1 Tax=Streptomyces sp. NPDC015220 TaxID=3364947 RepID=UPI0036F5619F
MCWALLGTGGVGRALADRLSALGHDVVIGARGVEETCSRAEPEGRGNMPFGDWHARRPVVRVAPLYQPRSGSAGNRLP